ncbi:MAG: hypothetical protein BGO38_06940 [Cellulomonas sp. 73-145]|mgnify:CR=1 FL=1|uniref:hypothetical protein n=1 Tax=Cellulomonas sp. 73-145 TaxID=1895739 RepID=UPI0009288F30|nr:hypothetical protein [Cellulomonas sp. 73-145]OJV57952.1 MAG: hypothetical protein BGO38_06940 [Cellulomonas sp. 73-145]
MDTSYFQPSGFGRFHLDAGTANVAAPTELNAVATPSEGAAAASAPWSPSNPLFWFGALAALTLGLAAVSTSVRVGPARASVSLGK